MDRQAEHLPWRVAGKDVLEPRRSLFIELRADIVAVVRIGRDFLLENIHLPMAQIGEKLFKTIEEWRDGSLQLDDMTMVGVRI